MTHPDIRSRSAADIVALLERIINQVLTFALLIVPSPVTSSY